MFERLKAYAINGQIRLREAEMLKDQLAAISGITESNFIKPERDESQWELIGGDYKHLDTQNRDTLLKQANESFYKSPHGRNICRLFEKYVAGRGFSVDPISETPATKEVWENFWIVNKMELRKKEIVRRCIRDGEAFLRYFEDEKTYKIRFLNPMKIKNPDLIPGGAKITDGIETDPEDIETVKNYYYKNEAIPAESVQHIKIMTDSDEVRGRSYFEPLLEYLVLYKDWIKDRMKLNKIRNTVALIKKVTGTPTETANIAAKYPTTQRENQDGTSLARAPKNVSVFTANKGVDYELKSPNLQASDVQHDGRALLLTIAAGSGLPEFMITSDASNGNFACYDKETEALTSDGWKYFKDISGVESIATIKPNTMELEYQPISSVMDYDFNGIMYKVENMHTDLLITPNHKMYISTKHNRMDLYRFREIKDVKSGFIIGGVNPKNSDPEIDYMVLQEEAYLTHPELNLGDRTINYDDWVEFLGYFISEGCIHKQQGKFTIGISQTKSHVRKKIIANLDRLPFKYKSTPTCFYIHDKSLWTWLFNNCGERSETRKIPDIKMSNRQATILLNALMDGDGHYPPNRSVKYYFSTSETLIDQVQELCVKLGYATTKTIVYESIKREDGYNRLRCYKVSIRKQKECSIKNRHIKKSHYAGKVYCVEVPNHTLIVRRNGKVCVSGNSTMIAEGPGVMEFEDWQDFFAEAFKEMFRRVIQKGISDGLVPEKEKVTERQMNPITGIEEEVEIVKPTCLECSITFPDIVSRNIKDETDAYETQMNKMGILSPQTASARLDLDFDNEQRLIEAYEGDDETETEDERIKREKLEDEQAEQEE